MTEIETILRIYTAKDTPLCSRDTDCPTCAFMDTNVSCACRLSAEALEYSDGCTEDLKDPQKLFEVLL